MRIVLWSLIGLSVALRFFALERFPGINGDEAWLAVGMQDALSGGLQWLTPSGRPMSPIYAASVFLVELLGPTDFWTMRLPALLSGLAVIPVSYLLLERIMGRASALVATALLACLPMSIAYSRITWELCQLPLAALIFVTLVLQGRLGWSLAALALAFSMHSTGIFLAPLAAIPLIAKFIAHPGISRRSKALAGLGTTVIAAIAAEALVARIPAYFRAEGPEASIVGRFVDFHQMGEFAIGMVKLFLGWSVFGDFAAPWDGSALIVAAILLFGIAVLIWGGILAWKTRPCIELRFLGAWWVMVFGFYIVAGSQGLQPGFERAALFLTVPSVVLAVMLLGLISKNLKRPLLPAAFCTIACAALLIMFWKGYFQPLMETGGSTHATYRTGPIEPKKAAFQLIQNWERDRRARVALSGAPNAKTAIIAESWWLYWPLRYLAGGDREFRVYYFNDSIVPTVPASDVIPNIADLAQKLREGAYLIGFHKGLIEAVVTQSELKLSVEAVPVPDSGGRPALLAWRQNPFLIK